MPTQLGGLLFLMGFGKKLKTLGHKVSRAFEGRGSIGNKIFAYSNPITAPFAATREVSHKLGLTKDKLESLGQDAIDKVRSGVFDGASSSSAAGLTLQRKTLGNTGFHTYL